DAPPRAGLPVRGAVGQLGAQPGARPADHHPSALRGLLRRTRQGTARARHPSRPRRALVRDPAGGPTGGLAHRGLRAGTQHSRRRTARGRPVRRPARRRAGVIMLSTVGAATVGAATAGAASAGAASMTDVFLAVDPEKVRPGWTAFIVVILLCAAVALLLRSFTKQVKKVNFTEEDDDSRGRQGGAGGRRNPGHGDEDEGGQRPGNENHPRPAGGDGP